MISGSDYRPRPRATGTAKFRMFPQDAALLNRLSTLSGYNKTLVFRTALQLSLDVLLRSPNSFEEARLARKMVGTKS